MVVLIHGFDLFIGAAVFSGANKVFLKLSCLFLQRSVSKVDFTGEGIDPLFLFLTKCVFIGILLFRIIVPVILTKKAGNLNLLNTARPRFFPGFLRLLLFLFPVRCRCIGVIRSQRSIPDSRDRTQTILQHLLPLFPDPFQLLLS